MPLQTLEFIEPDWIKVPAQFGALHFRLIAKAPNFSAVQVLVFARQTGKTDWSKIGESAVDNLPSTPNIANGIGIPLTGGFDYGVHFAGRGHVLEPGFNSVTLGFDLSHAQGPLQNFGGTQTAAGRACGVMGQAFIRCTKA